jgi:hypothetical protein
VLGDGLLVFFGELSIFPCSSLSFIEMFTSHERSEELSPLNREVSKSPMALCAQSNSSVLGAPTSVSVLSCVYVGTVDVPPVVPVRFITITTGEVIALSDSVGKGDVCGCPLDSH